MPTIDTIVSQCTAFEPSIRTRCPRKAVADGLCVQHHRLRAFGIKLEIAGDEAPIEPVPATIEPAVTDSGPSLGKWRDIVARREEVAALPPAPVYAMPDHRHWRSRHAPEFYALSPVMLIDGGCHPQPYQLENGSPEQIALLERFRRSQERAWFRGGLTREQVTELFGAWPTQFGYPAYAWSVGDPNEKLLR